MDTRKSYNRRQFITDFSISAGVALLATQGYSLFSACTGRPKTEANREAAMQGQRAKRKLGIALMGLGYYATEQLAPALHETEHCYLAGIVTGTPDKATKWKARYNIPDKNIYDYGNFDNIKNNPDIDIVYVVLPNSLHAEYTIRAAKAGKHVICEKPMAISVKECDDMIAACKSADRMLSIGYRLHFEPHNQEMMLLGKEKTFGDIHQIIARDGMQDVKGWRLDKKMAGGGPLMDVGIYCIQGTRYTTGMEPVAVLNAKEGVKPASAKFNSVEASLTWQMEFPGNITANCSASYVEDMNLLRAEAANGWFELSPAYGYRGIKGRSSSGKMNFPQVNQQALQMDDFAQAVMQQKPSIVPGEMGRQDLKILEAIYASMNDKGKRVAL